MKSLNDRRAMFEAKFEHDEKVKFETRVKSVKLFGHWAAEKLGLTDGDAEAYAKQVMDIDFETPSYDEVLKKVTNDLKDKDISDHLIKSALEDSELEVIEELLGKE